MNPTTTAVVLAGGEGRRMGGADKGLQVLEGRPLVAWVIDGLRPQLDRIVISANRNLEHYGEFGFPVLTDLVPGQAGPLAGLHAAMIHASTPFVLAVPCDTPFLPRNLLLRLQQAMEAHGGAVAVPRAEGRAHRACCLARRDLLPGLEAFLRGGDRKVGLWLESQDVVEVEFAHAAAFENINSRADLERAHSIGAAP